MGRNSAIEWTHHTFNPWWGCTKVSPACHHCYAESWSRRLGQEIWGSTAARRFFGTDHWRQPLGWNRAAERAGERKRVFCASMADVFEHRAELDRWRGQLWKLIDETPWLDWLLLTKRPENVPAMVSWGNAWPPNVWLGTTAENQEWVERRAPHLFAAPAAIHFLSCEPLLGPIDLSRWLRPVHAARKAPVQKGLDWVIVGGESGPKARPMDPSWVRHLRDQCLTSAAAFHFKQWGEWVPAARLARKQDQPLLRRVGKKTAGRVLDSRTWDEVPSTESVLLTAAVGDR